MKIFHLGKELEESQRKTQISIRKKPVISREIKFRVFISSFSSVDKSRDFMIPSLGFIDNGIFSAFCLD